MPDCDSKPDQGGSPAVAYIAKCAEHGLHGERDDCFVCGEPVAMIGYVRADLHLQVHSARGRHEADARRLRAEVEALRELYTEENNERAKAQAEVERLREAITEHQAKMLYGSVDEDESDVDESLWAIVKSRAASDEEKASDV